MLVLSLLGYVLYITAIRHFVGEAGLSWVMSTIGFGIIVQNLALLAWGPAPIALASPLSDGVITILRACGRRKSWCSASRWR